MRVKLVKPVDPAEYRATCSGIVGVTGVVGELVEGYTPPKGKVAVAFNPVDLGYEVDEDDEPDPILLYIALACLEEVPSVP